MEGALVHGGSEGRTVVGLGRRRDAEDKGWLASLKVSAGYDVAFWITSPDLTAAVFGRLRRGLGLTNRPYVVLVEGAGSAGAAALGAAAVPGAAPPRGARGAVPGPPGGGAGAPRTGGKRGARRGGLGGAERGWGWEAGGQGVGGWSVEGGDAAVFRTALEGRLAAIERSGSASLESAGQTPATLWAAVAEAYRLGHWLLSEEDQS